MIEITAKLVRGHVFLSGETLECLISFSHPVSASHKVAQSNADSFESLAWASVQIHCFCSTDQKVEKKEDQPPMRLFGGETSLVEPQSGRVELATEPKILFCDLKLGPGQVKHYIYREKLPIDVPPSYRGQLVKYSYKISLATQQINRPIKLLRIPIRVLPLADAVTLADDTGNETTEELAPTNPFLDVVEKLEKPTPVAALEGLQNITARRRPAFYVIKNTRGRVVRFCVFKSAYKLGEDIVGTFDFSTSTVKCMQLSVALQCEEHVEGRKETVLTFAKHHEVCLGFKFTHLVLPIPLHLTPAFSTDLVSLKWRLHFEFVTTQNDLNNKLLNVEEWRAPSDVNIETMVWSLPIKLYATTPQQVAQAVQGVAVHKMIIR